MVPPKAIPTEDVSVAMKSLHPDWDLVNGKLHRELTFDNFVSAFAFMTAVAMHAERTNHHPEWSNVYSRVTIDLTTHDAGGISQFDLDMATIIDGLT